LVLATGACGAGGGVGALACGGKLVAAVAGAAAAPGLDCGCPP